MEISDLKSIQGLDLYLLDQILKGRLKHDFDVLDAGCGSGRNLIALHKLGFSVTGFDPIKAQIDDLSLLLPEIADKLIVSNIEMYDQLIKYDYVIVNAVLHFAQSHLHFELLFSKLVSFLSTNGQLFIRMTSNEAINPLFKSDENGIAFLPDNSSRYLLKFDHLHKLMAKHKLQFVEPLKTVNVSDMRCMSTIILEKQN